MTQTEPVFQNKYMQELWDWSKRDDVKPGLTDVERARFVFAVATKYIDSDLPKKPRKYNDAHPQRPDAEPWHEAKPPGQYRFGIDITGAKSWQCKFAGLTIYGLKTKAEALAKIWELRNEKLQSDFFSIANIEK